MAETFIPTDTNVALKKSDILLFKIVIPLLSTTASVPAEKMAFTGKLAPAAVIVQLLMLLPSLPVPVVATPVEKKIVPSAIAVLEP